MNRNLWERKTFKSSLLMLRALESGSDSTVSQAVELWFHSLLLCSAFLGQHRQLTPPLPKLAVPPGWRIGAAARLGFENPRLCLLSFKSLSSFLTLLSPSLCFIPLSGWGNLPPSAFSHCWNFALQHGKDTCKALMK